MTHALRMIGMFMRASALEELAYRANFAMHLFHSLLNLLTGAAGLWVVFGQVDSLRGWSAGQALALLGVYLMVGALRNLFIGPSLEALVGLGQEVWSGNFDFTLLRPVNIQFLVTFRKWNLFSLADLALGALVTAAGARWTGEPVTAGQLGLFFVTLAAGVTVVYAVLLAFTALVFWNPGLMLTWVFDSVFQLARYPVDVYPGWLRWVLTWAVPVGMMATLPAQALTGRAPWGWAAGGVLAALALLLAASALFHRALRRYASASS